MASAGPNSPGTVANRTGIGTASWSGAPTLLATVSSSNDVYGSTNLGVPGVASNYLYASNFGFSIPAGAQINGIVVEIERYASATGPVDNSSPKLVNAAGDIVGNSQATVIDWPTADPNTYITYGSALSTWGVSGLTGADVNDTDFGVVLSAVNDSGGEASIVYVDHIRMTVYYTTGGGRKVRTRRGWYNKKSKR